MPMTKAEILSNLVEVLALDLEDTTTVSQYFDDVVERLAFLSKPPFIKSSNVNLVDGTSTYNYEADMLRLIHALLSGKLLMRTDETQLNAYDYLWEDDPDAQPLAYLEDWLSRQYQLYPTPNFSSGDTLKIFYAEDRATGIQEYYGLIIALYVLVKEFTYSNIHQDLAFGAKCKELGDLMMKMVGHDETPGNTEQSKR
jgi:hypothetical protein